MKTELKRLSDLRVEIAVKLDIEEIKKAEDQAVEQLAKEVNVSGFRKGKAPVEVARKFIPANDLNNKAADLAVRNTILAAFAENNRTPMGTPSVELTKYVPGETIEYTATVDVFPEVKLGNYKKLGVKRETVKVAEKDIQDILDNLAGSFAEKKTVKRAAKKTDEVIIDFVGKKDGEVFQGGSAKDFPLVLGSNAFIPGFEDGIVGKEPGDKFDLELTFPKDYGMKDLAGAKTVFEVLLKQVNEVTKPAIDDELAKKCGPFKSLKELKDDIKKNITLQNEHRVEDKYKNDLVTALAKKSTVKVPESLTDEQMKSFRADTERNAAAQGMGFAEYLERAGETVESWEKKAHDLAEERVKGFLVLQELAKKEGIVASDELVNAKIAELREVYKKSPEALKSLKDPNVKSDIRGQLTIEETINYLAKVNK